MFDDATADTSPVKLLSDGYVLENGKNYYLTEDITIQKTLTPTEGNTFSLCLNGMTLTGQNTRTLFFKGTINLTDCVYSDETVDEQTVRTYTGSVISTLKGSSNTHAAVAYPRAGGVLNLFGGNLSDSTSDSPKSGSIVYVSGEMNQYGGKISGGNTSGNGGNISILDKATVNLYGGIIENGQSPKNGGNIYITGGCKMFIFGGQILGGKADSNNGGNIRVEGQLEITGGTIGAGQAKEGGNIAISSSGVVRMKGGTVTGGVATASGGNFAVFGKLSIEQSAWIKDGIALGDSNVYVGGGNIYGLPNATDIQITGGRIENGKSMRNGANIFLRSASNKTAKMSITGGYIGGVHPETDSDAYSVYVFKNNGTVLTTVGANAQIDQICFSDEKMLALADTALTEDASIGLCLKSGNGIVMEALDPQLTTVYEKVFEAAQSGKKITIRDNTLVIEDE